MQKLSKMKKSTRVDSKLTEQGIKSIDRVKRAIKNSKKSYGDSQIIPHLFEINSEYARQLSRRTKDDSLRIT